MISALALRYFAEVVKAGSLRSASDRLHVAASAISRQLALLEEDLGAPLLERGRGRTVMRLTAAGEVLVRYIRSFDSELERVRSEIEALKGLRKGRIRFGAPETFTRDLIPEFLAGFKRRFPGVTFDVQVHSSPRLVQMVSRDEIDVGLIFNPPASLHVKHVYETQLATCVLMASDHPLAGRSHLKLSDCGDYEMILPDETTSAKAIFDEMFVRARLRPRGALVTNSYDLMRSVAAAGLGLAIVNARPGKPVSGPDFRYVPLKDPRVKPQRMTICVFDGRNSSPIVAVFIEALKMTLDKLDRA